MTEREREVASEERLLARVRAARHESERRAAAGQLFERYTGRVFRWCYRHVGDHDRALDLSQEVFLAAYDSLGSFEGRSRFSSWLFAITRYRCVSAMRRAKPRAADRDPDELPDAAQDPIVLLEAREGEEAVLQLLRDHLDACEQEAIWLRCFERMPVEDITRVLDIQESSGARAVLQRARRKLRQALASRARREAGSRGG